MSTPSAKRDHIELLRAERDHLRQRLDLYRAKVYGPRPTRLSRLHELEREYELAESHLQRAERERDASSPEGASPPSPRR
jgi:hypothetical protein